MLWQYLVQRAAGTGLNLGDLRFALGTEDVRFSLGVSIKKRQPSHTIWCLVYDFHRDDAPHTKAAECEVARCIFQHFGGKTVDLTPTSMIAMVTGDSLKIEAAVAMLGQFDIIETVRTGKVLMARGEQPT